LNNANFTTPVDGSRGRMQMYIFPRPNPARSSGLDHDVLLHELTHGTSNRLHNNATGLSSTMARGMGEGWSDFYARALLSTATEDPNAIYPTAGWLTFLLWHYNNYYYGIRRFPYAVMSNVGANGNPHNPLTFADIDPSQMNTTNGAFPINPYILNIANEVHNVGEVWAIALLEVRARYINRLGFAVGNQRFLQFVTDGMKLDPVNPTLLQGRDSIIAAANAGGGTTDDIQDIWIGFATRGMGMSAQVINSGLFAVVESFDVPWIAAGSRTITGESILNGNLDPGELVTVSLCLTNPSSAASKSIIGALQASGKVTSPSGPQSYGTIPAMTSVCRSFSFTVNAYCGEAITATLQTQESGGGVLPINYSFDVGTLLPPSFSENFDAVTAPALPAGWTTSVVTGFPNPWVTAASSPDTPPNKAFIGNPALVTDSALVSPVITLPPVASRLTFSNFYNLESGIDGGVLEIALAPANQYPFQDISSGGSFVTGGYTGNLAAGLANPISGRRTWTGNAGSYLTTTVSMDPFHAAKNVQLRWRMGSSNAGSAPGWSIDSITISPVQCGVVTAKRMRGQLISD
jgi:hypothetical protein